MSAMTLATNEMQTENSLIEDRQHKRKQVLEQFLLEAKRRGELTVVYESKIREDF